MMLLSGWFLTTLDDGFFEVDTSSFRKIGGWTSGGIKGLDVLDIDLVSILEFTGVDSFSGASPSPSMPTQAYNQTIYVRNMKYKLYPNW